MSTTSAGRLPQTASSERSRRDAADGFRPEIQGLRTIAVLAVVLYHFWPGRLSGGYIGVDVFFVISGYLITSHIYREIQTRSTLALGRFWARRVRRLLPASFFVLLVSMAAVFLWVPATVWEVTARQLAASALYVQNWALATDSVDYSAQHNDASVVQHYWSLSVEEQFYFVWPLLVLALLFVARVLRRRGVGAAAWTTTRGAMIAGLAVVGAVSLACSIVITAQMPSVAYFVTQTRVWEFAAGALVALVFLDRRFPGVPATAGAWLGVALIAGSAVFFTAATPFPGWTALLPVAGTALVLAFAGNRSVFGPRWWLSLRPMTFVGGISYGLYLWHWPLLIVTPYVLGRAPGFIDKSMLLAAAILLSWLTKLAIEDPLRKGRLLGTPARAFSFAAAGMAVVVALSYALTVQAYAAPPVDAAALHNPCYGPGSLDRARSCGPVVGTQAPNPAPALVSRENTDPLHPGCQGNIGGTELVSCDLGVDAAHARTTVAIVGDSHATAWLPAIEALAAQKRWHIKTFTKASCPATAALRVLPSEKTDANMNDCSTWVKEVSSALAADKSITTVFTAAFSTAYSYRAPADSPMGTPAVQGYEKTWQDWLAAGKRVVAFEDVPRTNGQYVPTCLASHPGDPLACANPVAAAFPSATMAITHAAEAFHAPGFEHVRLRAQFCDAKLCYPQVGSVIVYRDYSHISAEYSRALAPYVSAQLH
ncbi:acyltransferase [Paenarthrobacter sp. DKR-5]|uniref:acyltransferase family protein n=1 Tax=Paenarthrobacter sp. DKR-5 TaxID=2835535 RepID=UPI001BDD1A96|nr:acyltransferase family protein [Paenarthrobacter sp. DKR-5]MBT1001394.1 acyltransferase [Paenarthrobacter sp. DKR-5]